MATAYYDLALSTLSHDLLIVDGDLLLIDNAERIAQQIKITLKFFLSEWFLDTSKGIPYLDDILVKNPNINHIYSIFKAKITDVPGVEKVTSLDLDFDRKNRTLTVTYEVETTYGLVTKREVLGYS